MKTSVTFQTKADAHMAKRMIDLIHTSKTNDWPFLLIYFDGKTPYGYSNRNPVGIKGIVLSYLNRLTQHN